MLGAYSGGSGEAFGLGKNSADRYGWWLLRGTVINLLIPRLCVDGDVRPLCAVVMLVILIISVNTVSSTPLSPPSALSLPSALSPM